MNPEQLSARTKEKYSAAVDALYNNRFEEVPKEFVSVFHYTSLDNAENIATNGLRTVAKPAPLGAVDEIFDSVAPHGLRRSTAVYAALPSNTEWGDMKNKGLELELKINPERAYVVDSSLYTDAIGSYLDPEMALSLGRKGAEEYARMYWARAMSLKDFLKSASRNQSEEYEVLIPYVIEPKFIRAHKQ